MYVCICNSVTDRQIFQAVDEGAATMNEISNRYSIGSNCGKCIALAQRVFDQALREKKPPCTTTN